MRLNIDGLVDSYKISDIDESGSDKYYGFLDKFGNWYILKMTDTSARYCRGFQNYVTKWATKTGLVYGHFNEAFKLGGADD